MNAMGIQMGSTMSMGSTGSTETESSLESSCSKDSASTSSSLSTSSCEPASTVSYGSATGGGSSSVTSKTTETSTIAYATPRKDVARTSPIASTDLSTAITQELQRRAQQVDVKEKFFSVFFSKIIPRKINEQNSWYHKLKKCKIYMTQVVILVEKINDQEIEKSV